MIGRWFHQTLLILIFVGFLILTCSVASWGRNERPIELPIYEKSRGI